jgi:hypothetical protein
MSFVALFVCAGCGSQTAAAVDATIDALGLQRRAAPVLGAAA